MASRVQLRKSNEKGTSYEQCQVWHVKYELLTCSLGHKCLCLWSMQCSVFSFSANICVKYFNDVLGTRKELSRQKYLFQMENCLIYTVDIKYVSDNNITSSLCCCHSSYQHSQDWWTAFHLLIYFTIIILRRSWLGAQHYSSIFCMLKIKWQLHTFVFMV